MYIVLLIERESEMYYFIVNKHAKTGNSIGTWNSIKTTLNERGISYRVYETLYAGYASQVAKELTENATSHINIIIVGGDGTINEVVNGISDFSKVSVGVIPAGTGNDFARNIGIKGDCNAILDDIMTNKQATILDLGAVSWESMKRRQIFAISSGLGFDALVTKKNSKSRVKLICNKLGLGKLSYLLLTIQSLFTLKTYRAELEIDESKKQIFHKVIFSCAMNLKAEGGGIPMAPHASATDRLLSYCVAADIPVLILPIYLIHLVLGKHEKLKCFHVHNCSHVHIKTSMPVTLHCDGEYLGEVKEVWYDTLPQKLSLLNTLKDK